MTRKQKTMKETETETPVEAAAPAEIEPKAEPAPAPKAAPATSYEMTITEFCARLSQSDRRVELIGAFHATETQAGRQKGREADFRSRFQAFIKQPA